MHWLFQPSMPVLLNLCAPGTQIRLGHTVCPECALMEKYMQPHTFLWKANSNSTIYRYIVEFCGFRLFLLLSANLLLFLITSLLDLLMTTTTMSKQPKRKFQDRFLEFGFVSTIQGGDERPLCLICRRVLANGSMTNTRSPNSRYPQSEYEFGE